MDDEKRHSQSTQCPDEATSKSIHIEPEPVVVDFPDGGVQAWLCAFGSFMISAICYGILTSYGAFEEYYRVNQLRDNSLNDIGWIGSLELCLVLLTGCISGPLFDRGYLKSQIAVGGLLYVFCLCMTSISTKFYQILLAQGFGVGIAQGIIFTPAMSCLAHHFKRLRIVAFGIFACGASVGGVVFPIMLQQLFAKVGFGWTVRILALIVLVCVIAGVTCCSTRLPPRKNGKVLDVRVFKDISYTFLVLGSGLGGLGLYAPVSYGVTYAVDRGMGQQIAFYSLSILNASSIIGRVAPALISPRIGPLNVFIIACTLSTISLFAWVTARSERTILVFDVFYGVFSGAWVACVPASVSSLTQDPKETGVRLGMLFFAASFFWLVGTPIQGVLIRGNASGSYWPCAIFSGACVGVGVGTMLVSRYLALRRMGPGAWKV